MSVSNQVIDILARAARRIQNVLIHLDSKLVWFFLCMRSPYGDGALLQMVSETTMPELKTES
jgi:hypothetical protein